MWVERWNEFDTIKTEENRENNQKSKLVRSREKEVTWQKWWRFCFDKICSGNHCSGWISSLSLKSLITNTLKLWRSYYEAVDTFVVRDYLWRMSEKVPNIIASEKSPASMICVCVWMCSPQMFTFPDISTHFGHLIIWTFVFPCIQCIQTFGKCVTFVTHKVYRVSVWVTLDRQSIVEFCTIFTSIYWFPEKLMVKCVVTNHSVNVQQLDIVCVHVSGDFWNEPKACEHLPDDGCKGNHIYVNSMEIYRFSFYRKYRFRCPFDIVGLIWTIQKLYYLPNTLSTRTYVNFDFNSIIFLMTIFEHWRFSLRTPVRCMYSTRYLIDGNVYLGCSWWGTPWTEKDGIGKATAYEKRMK